MTDTEDRLRSLMTRLADAAPMPPAFDELGTRVNAPIRRERKPALVAVWATTAFLITAAGVALMATRRDEPDQPTTVSTTDPHIACEMAINPHGMTDENIRTLIDYVLTVRPDSLSPEAISQCKDASQAELDRIRALIEQRRSVVTTGQPTLDTAPAQKAACEIVSNSAGMTDESVRTLIDYLLDVAPGTLAPEPLRNCKGATQAELDRIRTLVEERRTALSMP